MSKYLRVFTVPMLKDNYSYLVQCLSTNAIGVVDVSEPAKAISALAKANNSSSSLTANDFCILTTHRHADHAGGNEALAKQFPGLKVYGGLHDRVPATTHPLNDGDSFTLGELTVNVLHTPCHTKGHVLYHIFHNKDKDHGVVFTGDTVFVGGLGAFFEGDARMMIDALKRFAQLPPETMVYPGHEYTMNFMGFATTLESESQNPFLKQRVDEFAAKRKKGEPTVPSTVGDELQINPFVRAAVGGARAEALLRATKVAPGDPVALMQKLYDTCP